MSRIVQLALNDLRLVTRDRPAAIWMLALPVAMMWFLGGLGGGGSSGPPRTSLGVVNHDAEWLSVALIEELTDERITLTEMTPEEAALAENKVRTLIIPEHFTRDVLAAEPSELRLEKEPGSSAEFGVNAQIVTLRAVARTLPRLVEMGDGQAIDDAALDEFRRLGQRAPLVRLEVTTAGQGRAVPSGRAQSVPGVMTMTVLMMTLIYGGVFLTLEKQSGMLRRQATAPMSRMEIFVGKLAGRMLVAGVQLVALLAAGRFLFGLSWGRSPLGLLLLVASYMTAVASMSTFLGAVVRTPGQASSVGWIGSMVLAALGGCWWPAEVMPAWLRTAAHVFPTAWAMDGFHALISFGRGVEGVWLPSAVLLGFALVFTALGARLLSFDSAP